MIATGRPVDTRTPRAAQAGAVLGHHADASPAGSCLGCAAHPSQSPPRETIEGAARPAVALAPSIELDICPGCDTEVGEYVRHHQDQPVRLIDVEIAHALDGMRGLRG